MNRKKLAYFLDQTTQLAMVGFVGSLPVSIAFTQSSLFLGWLAWLLKCLVEKRWNGFKTPLDLGFVLFLASALLSTVFSLSLWESFISLKKFYLLSAVYFIGFNVKSPERLLALVKLFLMMTALTGVYGLVMFGFGYQPRLLAAQGMAMTSGGIFMMAGLLSVANLQNVSPNPRIKALGHSIIVAMVLFSSLAFTRTVSSWFGFMIAFPVMIRSRWKKTVTILLTLLLLVGVIYTANNLRLSFKYFYGNKATSWNMRLSLWRAGWQVIKERPVFGAGLIDLGRLLEEKRTMEDEKIWQDIRFGGHLHNNFIQITAIAGFAGLAAFIFMWVKIINFIAHRIKESLGLLKGQHLSCMAVVIAFLANGMAEWNFGDSEVVTVLWFAVGLVVAGWKIHQNDETNNNGTSNAKPAGNLT